MSDEEQVRGKDLLSSWLNAVVIVVIGIILIAFIMAGSGIFRRKTWQAPDMGDFSVLGEMRKVMASALGFVIALSINDAVLKTSTNARQGCKCKEDPVVP